jgi:putative ABC transport system permease protein
VSPHPDHGDQSDLYTVILPVRPTFDDGVYVLRTDPSRRDAVLKAAVAALERANPHRVAQEHGTFEDLRGDFYKTDLAMVWLLAGVCVALLVVTAFGIVGLASFWVQQRTRMIGTRRALGATRGQIRNQFLAESVVLALIGGLVGVASGVGATVVYSYSRGWSLVVPIQAWTGGIGAAVLIGTIAGLLPALRAARLSPTEALHTG